MSNAKLCLRAVEAEKSVKQQPLRIQWGPTLSSPCGLTCWKGRELSWVRYEDTPPISATVRWVTSSLSKAPPPSAVTLRAADFSVNCREAQMVHLWCDLMVPLWHVTLSQCDKCHCLWCCPQATVGNQLKALRVAMFNEISRKKNSKIGNAFP